MNRFRTIPPLLLAVLALATAGCSNRAASEARTPLTERQRDSVISKSVLPGAGVVGRALAESDRAARQGAAIDSITGNLPR